MATAGGAGETPLSGYANPRLSPQGDRLVFARQACVEDAMQPAPQAASLWAVGSDGRNARRLGTAAFIQSAVWDPTGRFVAYCGRPEIPGGAEHFIRVVEVATGAETDIPLPEEFARSLSWDWLRVTNWSSDGRLLGIAAGSPYESPWEFWVVQGLQEGER